MREREQAIERGDSISRYFADRKARGAARREKLTGNFWYFGLIGLETDLENYDFMPIGYLARTEDTPSEIELAGALREKRLLSSVARYSPLETYEVAINQDGLPSDQKAFDIAWWFVSALRLRTLADLLVPVALDHSWSVIPAVEPDTCEAHFIEDVPFARKLDATVTVSRADLHWAVEHMVPLQACIAEPNFRLAIEAFTTHQHQASPRMMAALLWSGLEALVEVRQELKFRLSTMIASLLEPRGASRRALYERIGKLYDQRSKAVHGGAMRPEELDAHTIEVRRLLQRVLVRYVQTGRVLTVSEVMEFVFS